MADLSTPLKDALVDKIADAYFSGTKAARGSLNKEPHVLDLSYSTMVAMYPELDMQTYSKLREATLSLGVPVVTHDTKLPGYLNSLGAKFSTIVFSPAINYLYLIASSYGTTRTYLTKILHKVDSESLSSSTLGHIIGSGGKGNTNASPLESKFTGLRNDLVEGYASGISGLSPAIGAINKALSDLREVHLNVSTAFINNINKGTFHKGNFKKLLEISVHIVVQSAETNIGELSSQERKIARVFWETFNKSQFAKSTGLAQTLTREKGANSLVSSIKSGILESLGGKATFTGHSSSKSAKSLKLSVQTPKARVHQINPFRLQGKFAAVNTANLQAILNQGLKDSIRKNMGTGGRKDILNYRTGRFAESVHIERLSVSREGMITAFYTYMKYPYQTFEPGFAQGDPSSRNPRLLISKSIRDIATTLVSNRMRAVLV